MPLVISDRRKSPLAATGDRRKRGLAASDYRMVSRRPQQLDGAAALPPLGADGACALDVRSGGGSILAPLSAAGTGRVLLPAAGGAALPALAGRGSAPVALPVSTARALASVLARGASVAALTALSAGQLAELLGNGACVSALRAFGTPALQALLAEGTAFIGCTAEAAKSLAPLLGDGEATVERTAIRGWLDLPTATVSGSGYSSVPDLLNGSNPAVQSTDGNRPANILSANGQPIADFDAGDFLSWAASTNNNQTAVGGFATWLRPESAAVAVRGILSALPGATNRVEIFSNGTTLIVNVHHSQFVARRATLTSAFAVNTWRFLTWEFDGSGADDAAKCVVTLDGVPQTLTFTNDGGSPGAMPSSLVATAGPYFIGARGPSGAANFFDGQMGPYLWWLGGKMSGATTGLLTTTARDALMKLNRPT